MWRSHKEANRPFPKLSDDDVIDYLIIEALTIRDLQATQQAEKEAEKKQEVDEWKNDIKGFEDRLATAT